MSEASTKRVRAVIDVFRYRNYREFLAAFYEAKKRVGYSYRAFAKAASLGAPNYLKLVISGERNLSPPMAERFASACRLQGDSRSYFLDLVEFNQAQSDDLRNDVYERLRSYARFRAAQPLELAHAEYHTHWYIPVVRELVGVLGFREDPDWIAATVRPNITRHEAVNALAVLSKLGLVEQDIHGRLRQSSRALTTGEQARGLHIRNFHAQMMHQAIAAMEGVSPNERFLASLTLSASESTLEEVRRRVVEFRQEMLALCDSDPSPERVMQLNLQWFPVTTAATETVSPETNEVE